MSESKKNFMQISGDKDFQGRSNSIFASLDVLEPQKEDNKEPDREIRRSNRRRPHVVPDHVLNPNKWTKYSLEEDGSEDFGRMSSNELNKHAALSFLDELKKRRSGEGNKSWNKSADYKPIETITSPGEPSKHSFSKPITGDNTNIEMKSLSKLKDGVHIMPEYIIGKTKVNAKPKKTELSIQHDGGKKEVQITHLLQRQDDELLDSDEKDSEKGVLVSSEEFEKGNEKKDEIKFVKRKRKQDKNIRKHVKTSDEDETE